MAAGEQDYQEPFRRIQAEEARNLIDSGKATVVDVREPWEYAKDHIPQAQLVPLNKILTAPAANVTADNVIFVCEVGQRSAVAAESAPPLGKETSSNWKAGTPACRKADTPSKT